MEQPASRTPFQQAGLAIEKLDEFEQLRSALTEFRFGRRGTVSTAIAAQGVPIRDFDRVRREKLLERRTRSSRSAEERRSSCMTRSR